MTFSDALEVIDAKTDADIRSARDLADSRSGWRSVAAEMILSAYCEKMVFVERKKAAHLIAECAANITDAAVCKDSIDALNDLRAGLGNHMAFFVAPGVHFNPYLSQVEYPTVTVSAVVDYSPKAKSASAGDIMAECKSAGQRKALEMLGNIARVRHEFPDISGISIPPTAMLVGMSGAGKSWVARSFAKMSRFPYFETTVSGWSPINSKADSWTLINIRKIITDSPCVILVDEADKIATRAGGNGNQNWYAGCQVELQNLLDRQMPEVPGGLNLMQKCHLSRSWIICAGAFQGIFRKKLGGEITLAEELEGVEITREDIEAESGITTELLNRVGPIVNVAAPTTAELALAFRLIDDDTGNSRPTKEREAAASTALVEMRGFRGLTDYAIKSGIAALKARKTK